MTYSTWNLRPKIPSAAISDETNEKSINEVQARTKTVCCSILFFSLPQLRPFICFG